ncbi:MAG TPA: S1/P1 nuclease [Terriglobia bacterium]|nr:S1/P1 nuclease [Terriglobia bacterium]
MSRFGRAFLHDRNTFMTVASLVVILAMPQGTFAWGREGHEIIVMVAEHYMRQETAARMRELLAPESPEDASVWADEYRHGHREIAPWHYIDIPVTDSRIDMDRECPSGDCVIAKAEQFLAALKDPNADKDAKGQALKFVIHFVGDMHQPLHVADNGDEGGNMRHVIFEG